MTKTSSNGLAAIFTFGLLIWKLSSDFDKWWPFVSMLTIIYAVLIVLGCLIYLPNWGPPPLTYSPEQFAEMDKLYKEIHDLRRQARGSSAKAKVKANALYMQIKEMKRSTAAKAVKRDLVIFAGFRQLGADAAILKIRGA